MKYRSAENKFLLIAFVAVLLLGVKTVDSLLEHPVVEIKEFSQRQPSSISAVRQNMSLASALPSGSAAANFDFNCQKDALKELVKEFIVLGAYLQIRGKGCLKAMQDDQVFIVNKSNGYTAAVFPMGQEEFQTDLIQLIEGQNQILIQYQNSRGKKFQREVVVKSSHI